MKPIESVNLAIETLIDGESLPSIRAPEFAQLVSACSRLAASDPDTPQHQAAYEAIGLRTVAVLLDRLSASMQAERELILLRGNSKPLC